MIVQCNQVQKFYGAQQVLFDITFEMRQGERIGLIGRNGAGKSTLFKLLTRELSPDGGQVMIRKGALVGSLAQIPDYGDAATVREVLGRKFEQVRLWQRRMNELEVMMTQPDVCADDARLQKVLAEYDRLRESYERAGGYEMDAQIDRVAAGIGIPPEQHKRPFATLSGGEKTKIGLAALLIEQPDLLLLDEPTNHLDMHAIEWLEEFLPSYPGTVVVVSHDRYFLDNVVTKVIEIEDGEAFLYDTNYSGYVREKEERLLQQFNEYQEQQKKIKKMQETIKMLIEWGRRGDNEKFFRRARSMQKALDRMEKVKRPVMERKAMDLELQQGERSGKRVAVFEDVTKGYGGRTLFDGLTETLIYGERVFLIGENGAGKSTLFKLLLEEAQPDGGRIKLGSNVEIGYLAQEQTPQDEAKTVLQYFREEAEMEEGQARRELAHFLFYGGDVFKAVKNLSGGEWSRLRLALLMYRMPNLLLLDEPTNHLDISSREALEEALDEFPGTLLIISHDRYFINRIAQKVWALEGGELTRYLGNFEYYKEKRPAHVPDPSAPAKIETAKNEAAKIDPAPAAVTTPEEPRKKGSNPMLKAKLEGEIAATEARLEALEAELNDPANVTDAGKLGDLLQRRDEVQGELDALYEKWMGMED
jgi:ATP-binding cassette, subfamily F, member 3